MVLDELVAMVVPRRCRKKQGQEAASFVFCGIDLFHHVERFSPAFHVHVEYFSYAVKPTERIEHEH
jgi:hypothetical protein